MKINKYYKKFTCLILALMIILSAFNSAFAAGSNKSKSSKFTLKSPKVSCMQISIKKIKTSKKVQIKYSLKSSMKSSNKKTIKTNGKAKKITIKKLRQGKKYYVQIRYQKNKKWLKWSNKKSIKIKKKAIKPIYNPTNSSNVTTSTSTSSTTSNVVTSESTTSSEISSTIDTQEVTSSTVPETQEFTSSETSSVISSEPTSSIDPSNYENTGVIPNEKQGYVQLCVKWKETTTDTPPENVKVNLKTTFSDDLNPDEECWLNFPNQKASLTIGGDPINVVSPNGGIGAWMLYGHLFELKPESESCIIHEDIDYLIENNGKKVTVYADYIKPENMYDKVIFLDIDGVIEPDNHTAIYDKSELAVKGEIKRKFGIDCDKKKYKMSEVMQIYYDWDKDAIARIMKICDETGAKIVMSTGWRDGAKPEKLKDYLTIVGLDKYYIDDTHGYDVIQMDYECAYTRFHETSKPESVVENVWRRSPEIWHYVHTNSFIKNFVSVDDMLLGERMNGHYQQTSEDPAVSTVITDEEAELVIKKLNDPSLTLDRNSDSFKRIIPDEWAIENKITKIEEKDNKINIDFESYLNEATVKAGYSIEEIGVVEIKENDYKAAPCCNSCNYSVLEMDYFKNEGKNNIKITTYEISNTNKYSISLDKPNDKTYYQTYMKVKIPTGDGSFKTKYIASYIKDIQ